jgi:hypothetical protein
MNDRDLCERIKQYGIKAKLKAECGGITCDLDRCPHCRGRPGRFKRHGVRKRLFLVFAEDVIQRVWSYLSRWKCPLCKRTFTLYPAFALPFKRYVLAFIQARCAAYVADEARTYREGVEQGGVALCHEDADSGAQLWPSTLWRWVSALGHFAQTVRQALNLIKQKDPATGVFRALGGLRIREGKFRSQARKRVLRRCYELVTADRAYARLFTVSVFPGLATACGFR